MTSIEAPRHPRATGLLLSGILTGVLLASGSFGLWILLAGPEKLHVEAQEEVYREPVTAVDIDLNYTSVVLIAGEPGRVTVRRQITWSRAKPVPEEQVIGGTLQIRSRCPYVFLGRAEQCQAEYVVEVPPATSVEANVHGGKIRAEELTGVTHLTTMEGDITVAGLRGRLWARSTGGDITGTRLGGSEADVKTAWGIVSLRFAVAPDLVQASANSGDVSIAVPRAGAGPAGYQIRADAEGGRQEIDVLQDSTGQHTIVAHTNYGDVNVRYTTGG